MTGLPVRIVKETEKITKNPPSGIKGAPKKDNPRHFDIFIEGPKDSPYEKGTFQLEMFLGKRLFRFFCSAVANFSLGGPVSVDFASSDCKIIIR